MTSSGTPLDLSKPIEVTNETIVIIDGKKCVLSANPDTGQLCAYPVLPSEGMLSMAPNFSSLVNLANIEQFLFNAGGEREKQTEREANRHTQME
jgi:hypothetical protein